MRSHAPLASPARGTGSLPVPSASPSSGRGLPAGTAARGIRAAVGLFVGLVLVSPVLAAVDQAHLAAARAAYEAALQLDPRFTAAADSLKKLK